MGYAIDTRSWCLNFSYSWDWRGLYDFFLCVSGISLPRDLVRKFSLRLCCNRGYTKDSFSLHSHVNILLHDRLGLHIIQDAQ
jgi:hypothetical protein